MPSLMSGFARLTNKAHVVVNRPLVSSMPLLRVSVPGLKAGWWAFKSPPTIDKGGGVQLVMYCKTPVLAGWR
jgi:hypothetical protein